MDEYQVAASQEAEELRVEAEAASAVAMEANQTGDNYVLTTVLFASVLFFAGITTKFRGRWIKLSLVGLGLAAFVAGTSILLSYSIH